MIEFFNHLPIQIQINPMMFNPADKKIGLPWKGLAVANL